MYNQASLVTILLIMIAVLITTGCTNKAVVQKQEKKDSPTVISSSTGQNDKVVTKKYKCLDKNKITTTTSIKKGSYTSKHGFSLKFPSNWTLTPSIEEYCVREKIEKNAIYIANHFTLHLFDETNNNREFAPISDPNEIKLEVYIHTNTTNTIDDLAPTTSKYVSDYRYKDEYLGDKFIRRIWGSGSDFADNFHAIVYMDGNNFASFNVYPKNSNHLRKVDDIIKSFEFTK